MFFRLETCIDTYTILCYKYILIRKENEGGEIQTLNRLVIKTLISC
jgi:hypothetical protein